ncbi:MAG: hypothetical protein WC815_24135 [Vicinamibacterales bacterium]
MKRLVQLRMNRLPVPSGADETSMVQREREAIELIFADLDRLKAAEGCPRTTDEEIAGDILRAIGCKPHQHERIILTLRGNDDELASLTRESKAAGLSLNSYVRRKLGLTRELPRPGRQGRVGTING